MDIGSVNQIQTPIHLGQDFDGDAIWQELDIKISNNQALTSKDKLNIMLLPMMSSKTTTPSQRAWQVTETVKQLPEKNTPGYLIGMLMAANYSALENPEKSKILEVLKMAQPFQELYQEFEQKGIEKGIGIGMEKGMGTKALEVAKKMLAKGMLIAEVVELTELPKEEVQKLKLKH